MLYPNRILLGIGTAHATNLGMNYQDKSDYTGHTTDTRNGSTRPAPIELLIAAMLAVIAAFVL